MAPREEAAGGRSVTDDILGKLGRPGAAYLATVAGLLAVLGGGLYAFAYQVRTGLGVAGYQPPILWGVYITNFVFWIGITHSGTLISAVLFLFRARWRTGVARASEAMTVFAIMTGALFPIVHLGRPWLFYWLLPIPNEPRLVGELPVADYLGPVRHHDLPDGERRVPVRGHAARHRHGARPHPRLAPAAVPPAGAGLVGQRPRVVALQPPVRAAGPRWRCRWPYPCTASSRGTSPPRCCRAGTARSSHRTSSPAPSSPASP